MKGILETLAGLGVAANADAILDALSAAGSELLLSGSALVAIDGHVVRARPRGLVGSSVSGVPTDGVAVAVPDLALDGSRVGPGVALHLSAGSLVWAGLPEVGPAQLELLAPLADMGALALEQVDRRQRRRERVAQRLDGSQAMVAALIENTSDPVWALDTELRLTAFNRAFADMMRDSFGLPVRVGNTLDELPEPHRTRHERLYRRVLAKGAMRTDWTTPDRSRVFDVSLHPIEVGDAAVGLTVYCRDVTETRRAAALLRRAKDDAEQANRAKSAFLAQMSHEIRTPLNAIVGLTELMLDADLEGEQRMMLAKVKGNSNALLHLVSGILDFSQIEAGRIEINAAPLDLAALVVDAIDMLRPRARQAGLDLVLDLEEGFPSRVKGDAHRLRQIIVNLVENALKYTDEGRVDITLALDDGRVELVVEDTGRGIPEDEQQRIFDRFHRVDGGREVAGVGLGLAITSELVTRMGGSIEIESTPDVGTQFHVHLPLEVVRWEEANSDPRSHRLARPLRILVVDDSADNRTVTAALLQRAGHRVVEAEGGLVALDKVASATFDVVLLDVHMPDLDGLETTRRLRARGDELPIVALTAHATQQVADDCHTAGMDGFLTKPVSAATLEEEVLRFSRPPRVLVVDDSHESRLILKTWLEHAGAEVVEAESAEQAREVCLGPFDAFLLDHELPDGSGAELAAQLMEQGYDVPVAAISGHSRSELKSRWRELEVALVKPFKRERTLQVVDALLRKRFADDR